LANILPVRQFGWIRIYRNNVALTIQSVEQKTQAIALAA